MAELRSRLENEGLGAVRTHLQSGNVIVTHPSQQLSDLCQTLEKVIEAWLDLSIRVIARTREEMEKVVADNPLLGPEANPTMVHAVFLDSEPSPDRVAALDPSYSPDDRFSASGREIYVQYGPGGSGRSKLGLGYFERTLGVAGTARNWNTVTRLLEMLEE
jgi:uncharacterized protein (DUF1697 family)